MNRSPRTRLVLALALTTAATTLGLALTAPTAHAINPCSGPTPPPRCDNPPPAPKTATPTGLAVSNISETRATLTWTDPAKDESGFLVTRTQRATPNSPAQSYSVSISAPVGQTSFAWTDTGLIARNTVQWQVVARSRTVGVASSNAATTGALAVSVPATGAAGSLLSTFQHDWQPSAFPNVSKGDVLADLVHTLANPELGVNQGDTGACGPAAAEYELVKRHPDWFVEDVRSIADTGGFTSFDGSAFRAKPDLLGSGIHPGISPANWLFMATIKSAANPFGGITDHVDPNDVAWISTPGDVDGWRQHIAGLHPLPATPGSGGIANAPTVLAHGGGVVLLLDAALFGGGVGVASPNHYVNLLAVTYGSGQVTLTVETWGGLRTLTVSQTCLDATVWDVLPATA